MRAPLLISSLLQFAIDEKGLFDDPANAAKIAGHDLKGLNCYVNCNIEGLCFPLMALLDYRGASHPRFCTVSDCVCAQGCV